MVVDHMAERGADSKPPSPRMIRFRSVLRNRFLCIIHSDVMNDGFGAAPQPPFVRSECIKEGW